MLIKRIMVCVSAAAVALLVAVPVAAQGGNDFQPPSFCLTEAIEIDDCIVLEVPPWGRGRPQQGSWLVEVVDGPCPVACPTTDNPRVHLADGELACNLPDPDNPASAGNECTAILYEVTTTSPEIPEADLVGILARAPIPFALDLDSEIEVFERCLGDPCDLMMGVHSCQEQLVRYVPLQPQRGIPFQENAYRFAVVGTGNRSVSSTTVGVGAYTEGLEVEYCEILGLGREIPPSCVPSCGNFSSEQTRTRSEIFTFKECSVRFDFDPATGEVLNFGLNICEEDQQCNEIDRCCELLDGEPDPDCPYCCEIVGPLNVKDIQVELPDQEGIEKTVVELPATFGDGFISAGSDSCSCRVIGGRVYCWGKNCPN
jgi:hypothetical protein